MACPIEDPGRGPAEPGDQYDSRTADTVAARRCVNGGARLSRICWHMSLAASRTSPSIHACSRSQYRCTLLLGQPRLLHTLSQAQRARLYSAIQYGRRDSQSRSSDGASTLAALSEHRSRRSNVGGVRRAITVVGKRSLSVSGQARHLQVQRW